MFATIEDFLFNDYEHVLIMIMIMSLCCPYLFKRIIIKKITQNNHFDR